MTFFKTLLVALATCARGAVNLVAGVTILIALINAGKMVILQQPLVLEDFALILLIMDVWSAAYFPFTWVQVGFFLAVSACWAFFCRYCLAKWRILPVMRLAVFLLAGLWLAYCAGNIESLTAPSALPEPVLFETWHPDKNHARTDSVATEMHRSDISQSFNTYSFGLIPSLLLDFDKRQQNARMIFSKLNESKVLEAWLRQAPELEPAFSTVPISNDLPHVIIVLSESFWDPALLAGVEINPDPLLHFRSIAASSNGCPIKTFSPSFGGFTCNAEFELLTGISVAMLGDKAVPHRSGFRAQVPSLPAIFKSHGYKTVAIHPFLPSFWNRDLIYPQIGFDAFVHIDSMKHRKIKGKFISDDSLVDEILDYTDNESQPTFLFVITMQNHSPYGDHRYGEVELDTVKATDKKIAIDMVRDYVHGIRDADAMVTRLSDELKRCPRRTLLLFLGDHQPSLTPKDAQWGEYSQALRPSQGYGTIQGRFFLVDKHKGLGLMWANHGAQPRQASLTPLSIAALSPWILREAGLPQPPLFAIAERVFESFPVLCTTGGISHDGSWDSLPLLLHDPLLSDYQLICQDIVLGANYSKQRAWQWNHMDRN